MPNLTENYNLKKPLPEEFYDVNVQNENMDIIDDELKKLNDYTGNHNVKTYTSLQHIGVSDSSLSEDDFDSNITTIYTAMPEASKLYFMVNTTNCNNLKLSLIAKLNNDVGSNYNESNSFVVVVTKPNTSVSSGSVEVFKHLDTGFYQYKCLLNGTAVSPFIMNYHPSGFLRQDKTGGVHNIRTYTLFAQIGVSNDDFSATDLLSNLSKIFAAMPTYSELRSRGADTVFSKSIVAKLNSDLGSTFGSVSVIYSIKKYGEYSPMTLEAMVDYTNATNNKIYTCIFNTDSSGNDTLTKFAQSFNPDGFLPKTATAADIGAATTSGANTFNGEQVMKHTSDTPLVLHAPNHDSVFLGLKNKDGVERYFGMMGDELVFWKGTNTVIHHDGNAARGTLVSTDTVPTSNNHINWTYK